MPLCIAKDHCTHWRSLINLPNKILSYKLVSLWPFSSYDLCILFWTLLVIQEAVLVRNGVGDLKGTSFQQKIWNMNDELFSWVWKWLCEVSSLLFKWGGIWGEGNGGKISRGKKKYSVILQISVYKTSHSEILFPSLQITHETYVENGIF